MDDKRSPWQFTIRDLFWLTLVVALAIGWWRDNRQLTNRVLEVYGQMNELKLKRIPQPTKP